MMLPSVLTEMTFTGFSYTIRRSPNGDVLRESHILRFFASQIWLNTRSVSICRSTYPIIFHDYRMSSSLISATLCASFCHIVSYTGPDTIYFLSVLIVTHFAQFLCRISRSSISFQT